MGLCNPSNVTNVSTSTSDGNYISVNWTNTCSADRIYIWYNVDDGGTWNLWGYVAGTATCKSGVLDVGYKYGFRIATVRWCIVDFPNRWEWSGGTDDGTNASGPTSWPASYTTPVYRAMYADSRTGTISLSGSYTDVHQAGGTYSYTSGDSVLSLSGSYTDQAVMADTFSSTMTLTGSYTDALLGSTNYAYYLGNDQGLVYRYLSTTYGDAGAVITSAYRTKVFDFSDVSPEFANCYKTIYSVKLYYEDITTSTQVAIKVSKDGGATWVSRTKTVGTGTGLINDEDFDFVLSGQYFQFEIEHASADKTFKWIGLRVEFEPGGDYMNLND